MKNRKIIYALIFFCGLFVVICSLVLYQMADFSRTKVAFLNVGQGDAILISKGARQILIDGGRDGTVLLEQLGAQMPFWDRTIDIVIATHPDADHIDGLISVFENYKVGQFWHTNVKKETSVYQKLIEDVNTSDETKNIIAFWGLRAIIDDDVYLETVYPFVDDASVLDSDINDTSIASVLHIGENTFYFGGDLSSEVEDILPIGQIDVIKVSHHGSDKSTSERFLQNTKPKEIVISVGQNNHYGHPHADTMNRLLDTKAKIHRTDMEGVIIYVCKDNICNLDFDK
jgi:competence protein ComEC